MTTPSSTLRKLRPAIIDDLKDSQEARQLFYLSTVFAASRAIERALTSGESIVIDRYFLSTQAYAEFRGSNLRVDTLERRLTPATLTVYVDAPLAIRRKRVQTRGASPADSETLTREADARLRELHIQRRELSVVGNFVVIDSDTHSIDECVERVLEALDTTLTQRASSHICKQA
ncbi:hypothetical protein PPSIR1_41789 [Plesiocystis pacifica SIR-1]|uniref:Thymidylate kinase-like domain-containing protein n=2 Tax=Plesiocystis pacifica TaxID=191768 RepID=A6G0U9_9BACT|nr:hypothetical protein PPSIR1_41789 [Plesiocystis pacifica SIR-1]